MSWLVLIVAGLLEVAWARVMPSTEGLTRLRADRRLRRASWSPACWRWPRRPRSSPSAPPTPSGSASASSGTAIVGVAVHDDPATPARVLFLCLLVASIVGLKVTSGA